MPPAQYPDVVTPAGTTRDGAWRHSDPLPSAVERVGRHFASHVAFSCGGTVSAG